MGSYRRDLSAWKWAFCVHELILNILNIYMFKVDNNNVRSMVGKNVVNCHLSGVFMTIFQDI